MKSSRNSTNHKWRLFSDALNWVRKKNIKNKKDWKKLCSSKNFPNDIPKTPMHVYEKELKGKGMGYWYGTNKKSTHEINWRPFKDARKYVHDLEFQNTTEYKEWATTNQKPQDIPSAPKRVYKEFVDWEDWLGNAERKKKQYLNYSEAKKWAQSKKIPSGKIWRELISLKKIPNKIPKAPEKYYKEWEGWPKFLCTVIEKMTYEDARAFVQSKKITGDASFRKYKKENKLPKNFPRVPDNYYLNQGTWKGWGDFCNTGNISTRDIEYRPFNEAREFVRSLGLKTTEEWREYCKSGKKPDDIPAAPWRVYKEWKKK
jgi:hypothetical protein